MFLSLASLRFVLANTPNLHLATTLISSVPWFQDGGAFLFVGNITWWTLHGGHQGRREGGEKQSRGLNAEQQQHLVPYSGPIFFVDSCSHIEK